MINQIIAHGVSRYPKQTNKTQQVQLIVLTDSGHTAHRQQQKKDRQRTEEAQQQHTDSAQRVHDRQTEGRNTQTV